ncbi:MAG TPA: transcription antitermination factor NusB [Nocardioidaceae bacterium]|nr:transcription antitermination factor NusB [Nocardioidaceae bacterium]
MTARTKARKRALDILFECELRSLPLGETLTERVAIGEPPVNEYTITLVEGVAEHREQIDALLTKRAEGWTLARMPTVDRNILRIGAFEVLHNDDVPDQVAISEAVGLARELSTDESPAFVNGMLAALVRDKTQQVG